MSLLIEKEQGGSKETGLDRVDHVALGETIVATLIELHPNIYNSHDRVLPTSEQLVKMGRKADFLGESRHSDSSAEEDPVMLTIRAMLARPHLLALP